MGMINLQRKLKWGFYYGEVPLIERFQLGAHILVVRTPTDYISTAILLENYGWEIRDCLKVLLGGKTLQIGLFRKPFKGTVVSNVLKNDCGGINIDKCRIGNIVQDTSKNARKESSHKATVFKSGLKENYEGKITTGRFPANLLVSHTANCEQVGTRKIKGTPTDARKKKTPKFTGVFGEGGVATGQAEHADADGYETIPKWNCEPNCPVNSIDRQSGVSKSTGGSIGTATGFGNNFAGSRKNQKGDGGFGDKGGASRYFYNFNSETELREYLTNLIRV